ncbi:transcriptional repressor NsrR [Aquisphaera giovannonii]|uniref:Transcriptional repressor NsrR n=1 Tax=Aquisphaera giovannonii TaxID=406548 RepID=A0A5B9W2J4_9BACT|nr:Rrf2 family transcriptional regulator [Aquisphaera giovannonii]QEH34255.1 transcriptional repressor NsrR [Aquisphaera giovannonii]
MISQTAEYALRAVVLLGNSAGEPLTTQQIARASRVPGGYLSKVLQSLGRAGLVEARRGLHGGYVLTKGLDELSVYDVVNSVDPLQRIHRCPLRLASHAGKLCPLHQRLDDAVAMLEEYFKQTTIGSLLKHASPDSPPPLCEVATLVGEMAPAGPAPSGH